MSEVPRFEVGEHWRDSREKLNRIVDALNALRRMEGDEIVGVNREGDNLLLDMSIDQISARLPQPQFLYAKIVQPPGGDGIDAVGDGWTRYVGDENVAYCNGQRCDSDGNVESSEVLTFDYYHSPAIHPNIRQGDVVPYDKVGLYYGHIVGHYNDDKIYTVKIWNPSDDTKDIPAGWEELTELNGRVPVGPGGITGELGEEIDSKVLHHSGGSANLPLGHTHTLDFSCDEHIEYYAHTETYADRIAGTATNEALGDKDITPPFYTVRFIRRVD